MNPTPGIVSFRSVLYRFISLVHSFVCLFIRFVVVVYFFLPFLKKKNLPPSFMQHFHFQMLFKLCVNKMLCEKASCKLENGKESLPFKGKLLPLLNFQLATFPPHSVLPPYRLPVHSTVVQPFLCRSDSSKLWSSVRSQVHIIMGYYVNNSCYRLP